MRWEDERYVRVYTRDTVDWLALSWDAQALLMQLLRKVDRAGLLPLGRHGARGVAVAIGHPGLWSRIEPALEELVADGCIEIRAGVLLFRNFIAAQETPQSDKQRKAESRARAADVAAAADVTKRDDASRNVTDGHKTGQNVTSGHAESHGVTSGHSVPYRAVPNRTVPDLPPSSSAVQDASLPDKPARKEKKADTAGAEAAPFKAACDMLTRVYAEVRKADYGFGLDATRNGKAVRELLWGAGARAGEARGEPLVHLDELERRWRIGLARQFPPKVNAIWDLRAHWAACAQPEALGARAPPSLDVRRGGVRAELMDHTKPQEPF